MGKRTHKNNLFIKTNMYYNKILTGLFDRLAGYREERPAASRKYQLLGVIFETLGACRVMKDLLLRASQDIVLDQESEFNYAELAETTGLLRLPEPTANAVNAAGEGQLSQVMADIRLSDSELSDASTRLMTAADGMCMLQLTQLENALLDELATTLAHIPAQLERRHKDDEFLRLYESEKRRYMNSGTSGRSRQKFDEWRDLDCNGCPKLEDIIDYRLEKLIHMFEKKVLNSGVEHVQRATRFPGEIDFEQLDSNNKITKTVYHHYVVLRKMVDFHDGYLVPDPVRIGKYFYSCRHDEDAKSQRSNFLKYMHKIHLVQEEYRQLMEAKAEAEKAQQQEKNGELNYFAPEKNLKMLLQEEWFGMIIVDKKYNSKWTDSFVEQLMASCWRDLIAREWDSKERRLMLKCMIIGLLKDAGVVKGSYNSIARLLGMDGENPATLAKYMGMGKQQPYAEWVTDYLNS